MNGYQRIATALKGEKADGIPVMLHAFPHAAREAGVSLARLRSDPKAVARVFIAAVEKYHYDGILLDLDPAILAGAVGVPVDLPDDQPARCREGMLKTLEAVKDLKPADIRNYPPLQTALEATALLGKHFRNEVFLGGQCEGPFALASLMRSPAEWTMDLMDENRASLADRLLEYCTEAARQFIRLLTGAGVHMVSAAENPAGADLISPELYRRFAHPYEKRVVEAAHRAKRPCTLHIAGDAAAILDDLIETGADGLELDAKTDAAQAHAKMKDRTVFFGALDPNGVLTAGPPEKVEEKTRDLVSLFADTPRFVLSAGGAMPPAVPPENLRAMIRAARSVKPA